MSALVNNDFFCRAARILDHPDDNFIHLMFHSFRGIRSFIAKPDFISGL